MSIYRRESLLGTGKTKENWSVFDNPNLVILRNTNQITKFDDPAQTKVIPGKARFCTTTTCNVFKLIQQQGLPVAFIEKVSPTDFVAPKCDMISMEVVARRWVVKGSSVLKRRPELQSLPLPHRFDQLVVEFYLKTTKGELHSREGKLILSGLRPEKGEEDPLIQYPQFPVWTLRHPKKPFSDPESNLGQFYNVHEVLPQTPGDLAFPAAIIKTMTDVTTRAFTILEDAWWRIDEHMLIDFKIEFGIIVNTDQLVIADVIDNDSWRILWQGVEYSKQTFRDGMDLKLVHDRYKHIAEFSNRLAD